MDAVLLGFVKENLLVIGLALGILKVIARATPWAVDDEIVQVLTGFFNRNMQPVPTPGVSGDAGETVPTVDQDAPVSSGDPG